MNLLKSLIRTYFFQLAIDSFYSNFKALFLNGAEKGELIDYRALIEGMLLTKIVEHLGTSTFIHEHCRIVEVADTYVTFVCKSLTLIDDGFTPNFTPQRYPGEDFEENWVNYDEAEFYL